MKYPIFDWTSKAILCSFVWVIFLQNAGVEIPTLAIVYGSPN